MQAGGSRYFATFKNVAHTQVFSMCLWQRMKKTCKTAVHNVSFKISPVLPLLFTLGLVELSEGSIDGVVASDVGVFPLCKLSNLSVSVSTFSCTIRRKG